MSNKPNPVAGVASITYKKALNGAFAKYANEAEAIAEREAEFMAQDMHFILKNRFPLLGGLGRWPKFDPEKYSKHSHRFWELQKRPDGSWWLTNNQTSGGDEFPYPRSLINGGPWNLKSSLPTERINSEGFSKQMPKGLDPWIANKRKQFEENLKDAFAREL